MVLRIIEEKHQTFNNLGRYLFGQYDVAPCPVTVVIAPSHVCVCVQNAANRAWRGLGRTFHGADAVTRALAAYKGAGVRLAIQHAADAYGSACVRGVYEATEAAAQAMRAVRAEEVQA